jgi:hypothetical protein
MESRVFPERRIQFHHQQTMDPVGRSCQLLDMVQNGYHEVRTSPDPADSPSNRSTEASSSTTTRTNSARREHSATPPEPSKARTRTTRTANSPQTLAPSPTRLATPANTPTPKPDTNTSALATTTLRPHSSSPATQQTRQRAAPTGTRSTTHSTALIPLASVRGTTRSAGTTASSKASKQSATPVVTSLLRQSTPPTGSPTTL